MKFCFKAVFYYSKSSQLLLFLVISPSHTMSNGNQICFMPGLFLILQAALELKYEYWGEKLRDLYPFWKPLTHWIQSSSVLHKGSQNSSLLSILKWEKVTFSSVWTDIFVREDARRSKILRFNPCDITSQYC